MNTPNEYGCYETEVSEELARRGRSYATVRLCQCEDGLYRYALDMAYSYGGFCGPISNSGAGFSSYSAAKDAGTRDLLGRFPKGQASDPQSVQDELRELKAKVESAFSQPSLF